MEFIEPESEPMTHAEEARQVVVRVAARRGRRAFPIDAGVFHRHAQRHDSEGVVVAPSISNGCGHW